MPADVDRLLEIHFAAFPDPRSVEVRRRVFLQNRLGDLSHLRVAVAETAARSEIVGHAFSFPIGVWFGGRCVAGRAVASVGVAAHARSQGVAGALLAKIHAEARQQQARFTLLYPFKQGFYARMGYAPLARQRVLTVSPRAIPSAWRDAHPGRVRPAAGSDRPAIRTVYEAAARAGTGFIDRSERTWDHDLLEDRVQYWVLEHDDGVSGYAALALAQAEPHARVHATIHELVATSDASRRRLLASVAALGDQVSEVTLKLADDDPLDWALIDGDRDRGGTAHVEHAVGVVSTGPMLRLSDPAAALAARGYAHDGSVCLVVDGEPLTLEIARRAGRVSQGRAANVPVVEMGADALAAVAFGGLGLADAARLGWLAATSAESIRAAATLLSLPPFFSLDAF